MNPSCRFSSTKNTSYLLKGHFNHGNSHVSISRKTSSFFLNEPHSEISKSEFQFLHVKHGTLSSPTPIQKPSFPVLRIKNNNSKLCHHPFATLSSFAEAEGEEEQKDGIHLNGQHHHQHQNEHENSSKQGGDDLPGFAQAFNISPNTAFAISTCMALAALTLPFFMTSLGQGLPLKTKLLSYATLLFGFYMAWNIGANDVANAMGTSVGSGALTLRQAVLTAAVLEFSGALLMGTHVTNTMQKGLLVAGAFQGKDNLLFAGLLSSLAAAGTWLQVKSYRVMLDIHDFLLETFGGDSFESWKQPNHGARIMPHISTSKTAPHRVLVLWIAL